MVYTVCTSVLGIHGIINRHIIELLFQRGHDFLPDYEIVLEYRHLYYKELILPLSRYIPRFIYYDVNILC